MATITLKGTETHTYGELPPVGTKAPTFQLVDDSLNDRSLEEFKGKKKLLNIVPSLDTPVCATSTRKFNEYAKQHGDTVMLIISADLPFAQQRFCNNENLENVIPLSTMRSRTFGQDYGVRIEDGPFAGLCSRAVVVLDAEDKVVYTEHVPEIAEEPDYEEALAALSKASS